MPRPPAFAALVAGVLLLSTAVGAGAYTLIVDADRDSAAGRPAVAAPSASPSPRPAATAAAPTPEPAPPLPDRATLRALTAEVAASTGGRVQAAITAAGGRRVVAAASSGSTATPFRMWSVSKVATTIALLEAHGWGGRPGARLRPDVNTAIRSALVGSSDCAQRQLVVELQEVTGGTEAARRAVQAVLRRAGARHARVLDRVSVAGSGCRPFLERTRTTDPYRSALQLGTAEWTITDAARFARSLGDGTVPASVAKRITALLRREKEHSVDPFAQGLDVTSRLDWGAGQALRGLSPAYKAGWGGSSGETPTFVSEQVIHVRSAAGAYGIAVTFEPPTRPTRDDPGLTRAPVALNQLLRGIRRLLAI